MSTIIIHTSNILMCSCYAYQVSERREPFANLLFENVWKDPKNNVDWQTDEIKQS